MELGTIEREIHIEATPEVVYQVVSTPEHIREWWPEEAELDPVPGGTGRVTFGTVPRAPRRRHSPSSRPTRRAGSRSAGSTTRARRGGQSLLVTFDLVPSGTGTLLRFSEEGFREKGWEAAVLEEQYRDHVAGWDYFLPRLVAYAARLESAS